MLLSFFIFVLLKVTFSYLEAESIRLEKLGEYSEKGFQVSFMLSEKSLVKLNLSRSDKVSSDAPVYVSMLSGEIVHFDVASQTKFTMYQDQKLNAAFLKFPDQSLQGTFSLNNQEFYLQPKRMSKKNKRSVAGEYTVTLVKINQRTEEPDRPFSHSIDITDELKGYLRSSRTVKLDYVVEILIFIDYSIYQNWLKLSEGKGDVEAIHSIRYYYSNIVNAMDLRYGSINEQDFSIRVQLAGFVIAKTESASSWTHNYLVRSGDGQVAVDSYKVLDDFPAWLQNNADNLPNFDNALIFTRLPLRAGFYDNGTPRYISGLANIGAVCNNQAISINKENAPFATTGTASHELAHNLGSLHDIYAKNRCQATDQYIMSPAPGVLTATTALNPFQFSPCSINYMRQYLGALFLMKKNCLIQTTNNPSLDGIPVNKPVGQFLNIDRQCEHVFGSESFYCAGMNSDLKMCSSLLCYNPASGRCTTRTELRAANGTTCGDRKWCHMGSCVYNEEAPYASDSCLSGDYRGPDFNCKIDISKEPYRCYDEHYRMKCCAMCDFLKKQSSTCPYGDKIPSFCNQIRSFDCYNVETRSQCCDTCLKYKKIGMKDCDYGNRASWCPDTHPSMCYRDSHTCCALCHQHKLPFSDCVYGNMAEWCSNITTEQCAKVSRECCIECNPVYKRKKIEIFNNIPEYDHVESPNPCPLEDKWCRNMPAFACYETRIEKMCPCRCEYVVVSLECKYGDKKPWCQLVLKKNCPFVMNPSDCCLQCFLEKKDSAWTILPDFNDKPIKITLSPTTNLQNTVPSNYSTDQQNITTPPIKYIVVFRNHSPSVHCISYISQLLFHLFLIYQFTHGVNY